MNRDQVKSRVEQAKGSVKETTGKVVAKRELQSEGAIDKPAGRAQTNYGDVNDKAKSAIEKA